MDTHLPGPGGRGEELELPTGQETLTALRDEEGGGEGVGGEWEGVGRRGGNGNFYNLIKLLLKKTKTFPINELHISGFFTAPHLVQLHVW